MSDKHTPGPWILCNNIHYGWKTNPYSVCVQKKGVHSVAVANIPAKATISREEAQANARLIAAAPDLLDALLTLPQHHGATDQDWWDWISKARDAIDKAQGIEPEGRL